MKYIIYCTTTWDDLKPCKKAFKASHEKWHERTCTEEEFNKKHSPREGLWHSKGENHSVTKEGNIIRQEDDIEKWTIEINNLRQLNALSKHYGDLIIKYKSYGTSEIEIYDDYRE